MSIRLHGYNLQPRTQTVRPIVHLSNTPLASSGHHLLPAQADKIIMENATTYEVTSEGMPINPYNEALPPEGCTLDKGEMNIATGGYSKKATAASLCLKNVDDQDKGIVRMAQECKALAALLICLLTPVVSIFGARLNAIEAVYDDTIASIEDGDYNPTTAELQDAFRTKDIRRLAVKAIYQVAHWIRPPGEEEEDDPLSGRTPQFHHYYYGMDKWQTYYVFQLLSLIRRDFSRKEGVQWLDGEWPDENSKRTKKMRSCDQLRAALGSYAEDMSETEYVAHMCITDRL